MKHLLLTTIAAVLLATSAFADPIHDAVEKGNLIGVQAELDKGVDVNAKREDGSTPLHGAALKGHKEVAELLIDKGADVHAKDEWGSTPLHYAALKGHKEVAELLIDKGADVHAKDEWGSTPLHYAALKGHKEVAELLIDKGADVHAKGDDGKTPIDFATHPDNPNAAAEIADLLRKHGELALMPRLSFTRSPFGFTFNTIEGKTYRIESGMDLKKWNNLKEIKGTGNEVKFIDVRRIYFPQHFYRVKVAE
ncbi:MAG: ankyrin repeat domain-containing protein [Verrucomicrobiia bacterium]